MATTGFTPEVSRRIEDILNDREHGATFLAQEALRTLALAGGSLHPGTDRISALRAIAQRLTHARPAMAAIKNMTRRYLEESERRGESFDPRVLAHELLDEMDASTREATRRASEYVFDGSRVLTCSYSSAVLRTLEVALSARKRYSVVVVESRAGALAHGTRLLEAVARLGVPGELIPDRAIAEGVFRADMVILGADKLLPMAVSLMGGLVVS